MVETEVVDSDTASEADAGVRPPLDVSAHRPSPDRVVLVEAGNSRGWIAFDAEAAVSIER